MAARCVKNQRGQVSRLWQSICSVDAAGGGRPISTSSARLQEIPKLKVEEAEPVDIPKPKSRTRILVLGGNGFVGSHVCKEALDRGLPVLSLNRSGRPSVTESWVNDVVWVRGSLFESEKWKDQLSDVSAVVSCVGGFGSNAQMRRINGDANIAAINVAAEKGVKRFVYISAADFGLPSFVLRGYYEGKRAAEDALRAKFPYGGVILRPGFIHGNRRVGNMNIPLSAIGSPLELILRNMKPATQIPVIGPLLTPPVKVTAVAKAAVRAAIDNAVPPGMLDVWGILRLGDPRYAADC
ncbi:hypothetical protein AXG93_136s1060 [Marchantia polymorpha subsp. ruderalis]|uniref:NAD(P)-binding domain-containing protein n=3 Tax=Marchantia polymorpha TaxID=3197 RepID=A0A176W677_MARPO|nr:hypothetical protein AXG93_136s1060 [Marchantia polymorpha subsp. ruderalis]